MSPRSLPPLQISQGGRDFYLQAERASLPLHALDMLSVRFRQLTEKGLSPFQICGLVGCAAVSIVPPYHSVQRVFPSTAGRPVYETGPARSTTSSSRRAVCVRPSCPSLPATPYPRSEPRGCGAPGHHRASGHCRFTPGSAG